MAFLPGGKHVSQYRHIKKSSLDQGDAEFRAKAAAARLAAKMRAERTRARRGHAAVTSWQP